MAGLTECRYLSIGGIRQWIQIRGRDAANPVLLWLSGGPGASTIPQAAYYEEWEEYFTVVMWDQRGAGKTFALHGRSLESGMNVARMTTDGLELAEYLRTRFRSSAIILLGHSWGSILGIGMVRRRPDLFAAYVGTGQVTYLKHQLEVSYPLVVKQAIEAGNDEAILELASAGPPSGGNSAAYAVTNKWAIYFELASQAQSRTFEPVPQYVAEGSEFSSRALSPELEVTDVTELGLSFSLPMFFFQGAEDLLTTTSVVRAYFDSLSAPLKTFVPIANAGHFAIRFARDAFLHGLLRDVRPVVIR